MKFFKIILTLILLTAPTLSWSESERRDGNWWLNMNKSSKISYIPGYLDGMNLGYLFSCLKYEINTEDFSNCVKFVNVSYQENSNRYFSGVTSDQLSNGLDSFYADYDNRKIYVFNAVWIVAQGISGTPQAELKKLILKSRAFSAN